MNGSTHRRILGFQKFPQRNGSFRPWLNGGHDSVSTIAESAGNGLQVFRKMIHREPLQHSLVHRFRPFK
jgi:hypothetical protein